MIEKFNNTRLEVKARNRIVIDRLYQELDSVQKKDRKYWYPFVRQAYMEMMPEIINASEKCKWSWVNPYFLYLCNKFSNLEEIAWDAIRYRSVPLYPQFPIFNRFVDFGNPYLKIGLEVDSDYYHQDKVKDRERDLLFAKAGWRIFRISEKEVTSKTKYIENLKSDSEIHYWLNNTVSGLVYSIMHVYFQYDAIDSPYYSQMIESLNSHRLVPFDVAPEVSDCREICYSQC